MIAGFPEWLNEQRERKDPIGELARVLSGRQIEKKSTKRRPDEHRNWAEIVTALAEPGITAAFNEAWQEFLAAKKTG